MSGSDMCRNQLTTLNRLLAMLGDKPAMGEVLQDTAGKFGKIGETIGKLLPGGDWTGEASTNYGKQNVAQQLRANVMSELDKLSGGFISNQAGYVKNTRNVINAMKNMMEGCLKFCIEAEKWWIIGEGISYVAAGVACGISIAVTTGAMLYLTIMTLQNTMNLKGLLGRLLEMITTMPKLKDLLPWLPDIKFPPELKWPPEIKFPDIKWPDIKLPDFKWPDFPNFPGFPDFKFPPDFSNLLPGLPKLPDLFPGLPKLPDLIGGLPGLKDLFGGFLGRLPQWTDLPNLPDFLAGFKGLPTLSFKDLLSVANLPSINALSSSLGQLTQLTSGMGGGSQLLSAVGGQAGSLSSMAGAAGGGSQGATLVSSVKKDDEEDGAGAGTSGGERAPIEVTGGGSGTGAGTQGRVL
ncbi:EspA/EspE family type VII secretion system effector [Mycobacterium sp.]|uniref:EspA/EspE family type VII secretion system effector n=1 Tax=Mycobacterium sp. TaxID=1785 RepID=UPI002CA741E9|nr:EspA/EspE family type VII secretion system effector [Mycobacterium sp.]HTQ21539.1 EspA/EspE family type VII secretion system effector [Mycobacterium sp.]